MHYRAATPDDRDKIASLHIEVSQLAYAGILPAVYLTNVLPREKIDLWQQRLANGVDGEKLSLTVAENPPDIAGFVCFVFDQQTEFGTYLHNIYVSPGYQRMGVASRLLGEGIRTFSHARIGMSVSLLVLFDNRPAQGLYQRLGGVVVQQLETTRAGNPPVKLVRYQWPTAQDLQAAAMAAAR